MGLTDKHLAYGDDIPQTEKDYYWTEEQNNKLKEAISKIEDELKNSSIGDSVYDSALNHARRLIKKHTEGLV